MIKQLHCNVTGKVQGVMFRDFTQRKARGLNIVGTVENKPDGSVEIFAVGEEKAIQKLLKLLYRGPILTRIISHVDNIHIEWNESIKNFPDFKIIY